MDIVFDGPPGPEGGRFVEVENAHGESIRVGQWVHREDGYWALRLPDPDDRLLCLTCGTTHAPGHEACPAHA